MGVADEGSPEVGPVSSLKWMGVGGMSTVPVISCHDNAMAPVACEPVRRLVPISVFEQHDHCVF